MTKAEPRWPTTEAFLTRRDACNQGRFLDVGCPELGATDIHVDVVQPMLRTPADLRAHACTMEAIAVPVIDQGLATADEVADLVAELDEFAAARGAVATLPRIIQVSARAPEDPS